MDLHGLSYSILKATFEIDTVNILILHMRKTKQRVVKELV